MSSWRSIKHLRTGACVCSFVRLATMSNSRPREVLNAVHGMKDKGPPVADGTLSVTTTTTTTATTTSSSTGAAAAATDTSEAADLSSRRGALDFVATTSTYLEDETDGGDDKTHLFAPSFATGELSQVPSRVICTGRSRGGSNVSQKRRRENSEVTYLKSGNTNGELAAAINNPSDHG